MSEQSRGLAVLQSPAAQARVTRLLQTLAGVGDALYARRVAAHMAEGLDELAARGQALLDTEGALLDALDRLSTSIADELELRTVPPGEPVQ